MLSSNSKKIFMSNFKKAKNWILFHSLTRFHSSSNEFRTGRYAQVTDDVVFKHIMGNENVRNSLLGAVLGQPVERSELLDVSLNPIKEYSSLRKVVNKKGIEELMREISSGIKSPKVINMKTNRAWPNLQKFLGELALHYHQLLQAIPSPERNTELDVVCKTKDGLINIELQVHPQNFWDIRIMAHVCGLFLRQFPRSFKWSSLEEDENISDKVRRSIGVSIFDTAPMHQAGVQELLPWYDSTPWKPEEVCRHYKLTEQKNHSNFRPGVEFFDFNLGAVSTPSQLLSKTPVELREWLEFLAKAHYKQPEDIKDIKTPAIHEAFRMAEMEGWDEKLKTEYSEQQLRRLNISHFLRGEIKEATLKAKKEGMLEGKKEAMLEVAIKMYKTRGSYTPEIMASTGVCEKKLQESLLKGQHNR